eukprot:IDg172t1
MAACAGRSVLPRSGVSKLFSSDLMPIENTVASFAESFGVTRDDTAVHMRQMMLYHMQNTFTGRGVMFDMRRPGMHRCTTKAKQQTVDICKSLTNFGHNMKPTALIL